MIQASLARRYAKALLQIGIEDKTVETLDADLESYGATIRSSPELRALLEDPTVLTAVKQSVLKEIVAKLGLSKTTANFIQLLAEKGRIQFFADIHREFARMADEHAGRARAVVTSASPLPKDIQAALVDKLSRMTGRKVELNARVDEALLGGLVTEINGVVYDGSLRTQLRALRERAKATA